jgi:hypothetical protein
MFRAHEMLVSTEVPLDARCRLDAGTEYRVRPEIPDSPDTSVARGSKVVSTCCVGCHLACR